MTAIHGKRGSAAFAALTFEMISFTIDATGETADTTVMSSVTVTSATHWKTWVAGFKDWTATVECLEPAAGGGLAALSTSATLTLDTIAGYVYSGAAICTGFGPSLSVDSAAALSLSFQGNGQLTAGA